eukprot:NODE_6448_length_505_cov_261.502222.p1 GENE.NODE_6448_length_505_cov_261.502222~~NODE_6448_length_505_cov_261.502222.p1  ORF type:complete len:152 (-),score=19.08 NODE_6448_length_505_cov_261.502222:32-487(-)
MGGHKADLCRDVMQDGPEVMGQDGAEWPYGGDESAASWEVNTARGAEAAMSVEAASAAEAVGAAMQTDETSGAAAVAAGACLHDAEGRDGGASLPLPPPQDNEASRRRSAMSSGGSWSARLDWMRRLSPRGFRRSESSGALQTPSMMPSPL